MRVYVGTTFAGLRALHATAALGPAPLHAHAVTAALREWYVDGDAEELEYAAMTAAAEQSLRLLVAAPDEKRRRVVVAADVPDDAVVATGESRSSVRVDAEVPLSEVASIHVDDPTATRTITAAAAAVPAADAGDEDAAFAVDEAEGWELMWYATQELPDLLA